ncbi:MAG: Fe-S cluster assembly ATPase SufC [Rhabdochlamydiaceae bacterium]|nr:Fe-S cluster assembly ATPase SufC [Rhabdochlamydiaceae bacterium]
MLVIRDLDVSIENKQILKKFSLEIKAGEVHAIMGPNGAGKSTLAKILAGHPSYEVTGGEILFEGQNIIDMDPEERAKLGLFLSFQYPLEIPGLTNFQFLHSAYEACRGKISEKEFEELLAKKMNEMNVKAEFKTRNLNEGFSGGEKKKNELLQMAVLEPKLTILDEIDSGLDIDAMKDVAHGVRALLSKDRAVLIVTHYQRLLDYIKPDFVHVVIDGQIVKTGDATLALELEAQGYNVYS